MKEIYVEAGFDNLEKIGDGKILILTEQEHIDRYELSPKDVEIIRETIKERMNNAKVTENGYVLEFEFPIFLASL